MKKLLTLFILGMFMITMVSAFNFDNIKTEKDKTFDNKDVAGNKLLEKYKPIEITNAFGLGATLFEGYISSHDDSCGVECESIFEVKLGHNSPIIDKVEFYTLQEDESWIEQDVRSYQFYISTENKKIDVEDYEWQCTDLEPIYSEINGTWHTPQTCENVLIGTHKEDAPEWTPYNVGEEMPKDTYTVKLEADKKADRTVDWVITTQGKKINEWAVWNATATENSDNIEIITTGGQSDLTLTATALVDGYITTVELGSSDSSSQTTYVAIIQNGITLANKSQSAWKFDDAPTVTFSDTDYSNMISPITASGVFTIQIKKTGGSGTFGKDSYSAFSGSLFNYTAQDFIGRHTDEPANPLLIFNQTSQGTITLNSPADASISDTNNVQFNATATITGGATLTNMSLWTNESGSWAIRNTTIPTIDSEISHDIQITAFGSETGKTGMAINVSSSNITIIGFTKSSSSTATKGYIGTTPHGSDVGTCTFSGNDCNLSSSATLTANGDYFITTDCNGGACQQGGNYSHPAFTTNDYFTWYGRVDQTQAITADQTQQVLSIYLNASPTTSTQTWNRTITNDIIWNVQACDSDGDCGFGTSNYSLGIDTTAPSFSDIAGNTTLGYGSTSTNKTINFTATDSNLENCWIEYNGTEYGQYLPGTTFSKATNSTEVSIPAATSTPTLKKSFTINDYVKNISNEMYQVSGGGNPITATFSFNYDDATQENVSNSTTSATYTGLTYQNPNSTKKVNSINMFLSNAFTGGTGYERNTEIDGLYPSGFCEMSIGFPEINGLFNATIYSNDSVGNEGSETVSWSYTYFENNRTLNTTSYETKSEYFETYITGATKVDLNYNGTEYAMTKSGDTYSYTLDIPTTNVGNNTVYFQIDDTTNAYSSYQDVNETIFTICNATYSDDYLNISFQDEATLTAINGTAPLFEFDYYLGGGTSTKTYQFINVSENTNYTFCASPNLTLNVDPYAQFASDGYPQRIWNPSVLQYNTTVTNQILYLLSSSDGIYVTFQVINPSNQVISGVSVTAVREISGSDVAVAQGTTDDSGSVTFWLNPDFSHDFTFTKSGFDDYETSFSPTQTSYTVTLGGATTAQSPDYTKGITNIVRPTATTTLYNDTIYNFNYTISSSYWDVDSYGFIIKLPNGTILSTESDTGTGTVNTNINTSNYSNLIMDYYWVVNSTNITLTTSWNIINSEYTDWSIKVFFTDLNSYTNSGIFGLDDFGKNLIIFLVIFISVGIMGFKYGLTSPVGVMTMVFGVIFFFDVAVGLLPSPINAIPNFPTFITGLILGALIIREATR